MAILNSKNIDNDNNKKNSEQKIITIIMNNITKLKIIMIIRKLKGVTRNHQKVCMYILQKRVRLVRKSNTIELHT